jgi:hypothetical protein
MTEQTKPKGYEIPLTRGPIPPEILRQLQADGADIKRIEESRQKLVDEQEARRRIFTAALAHYMGSIAQLEELHSIGYSGSVLTREHGPQATNIGKKMELLTVRFYRIKGQHWNLPGGCETCFPLQRDIIPIIGDIYVKGKKLTEEEKTGLGWTLVTDDQGNPATYKIFASAGRTGSITGQLSIPVIKTEKGFRLIESTRELRHFGIEKLGPENMKIIEEGARDLMSESYAKGDRSALVDFPTVREFQDRFFDEAFNLLIIGALEKQGAVEKKDVVAVTFKGLGGKYAVQVVTEVAPGDVELDNADDYTRERGLHFVKRPAFEGMEGIIADVSYEPASIVPRPIGGAHIKEQYEIGIGRQLALNGAVLSGMTIGAVKILDKERLPELCISEIGITARLVFDDTRRAGMFQESEEEGFLNYRQYLRERFNNWNPDASLEKERDDHMNLLSTNIGLNMRAILDSGFTMPVDQVIVNNISTVGGLTDLTDLAELRNPRHAMCLCVGMIRMVSDLTDVMMHDPGWFFRSPHFKQMVRSFLGEKEADKMATILAQETRGEGYNDKDQRDFLYLKLGGILTDMWLASKGYTGQEYRSVWQMEDYQVLRKLKQDSKLMEKVGVSEETIRTHEKMLRATGAKAIMSSGKIVTPHDAVESLRTKIDSQERYLTGPNVRDTGLEQYRKTEGR